MNPQAAPGEMLNRAFERFEGAAAALSARVDTLSRELLDAHRRLEAVLDAVDGGVAVVSAAGRLLRTNRAFDRMPLDVPALAELAAPGAARIRSCRLRLETPEGPRDLAVTSTPAGDREGTRVLTVQDVTEIRREEEEGGRRARLEALGRMAAELAHEVRNPLGSVRLFASMLQDDLADRPEQRDMAAQILGAAAGLEATVSNLLAFAAPPATAFRTLDLAQLAGEVCALLGPPCAVRGVELSGPPSGARCPLQADPEGLRRVLLNLLGNALAATGQAGRVSVDVRRDARRARLTVEDTGCGIAGDDLPRVFDPFFSRTEGGTGLGLSIVHRIVERHGGRISIDSRQGAGTTVVVELPAEETRHA